MKYKVSVKFIACLLISLSSNLQSQTSTSKGNCKYWCPNREFVYDAIYTDNKNEILSSETITLIASGTIWEADVNQTLLTFYLNYNKEDSLKLAPYPLNGRIKNWFKTYQEGALEDSSRIWMHPIRQNQYLLTEIAPFPEVKFPLSTDKTWESTLWIYEAFGSFKGTVNSSYKIEKIEARKFNCGTYKCWKIIAKGLHDVLGENSVVFYFNEEIGFMEMNYQFFNGQKMTFTLVNFKM